MRAESSSGGPAPAGLAGGRRAWSDAVGLAARDRVNQVVFVVVLIAVGFGDSILLPFDFTQRISFANWHYFDARYVAFTVAFAIAMAWVLTLQVHAMRRVVANARSNSSAGRGGPLGVLAAVVSLLPSFLCCSPIVPTLVGLFGLSATTQLRTTGRIEYFFATKQDLLLAGSLALVVASGLWSVRKLARAACLDGDEDCAVAGGPVAAGGHSEGAGSRGRPAEAGQLAGAAAAGGEKRDR